MKVSIVVPIYNVESYLGRCVDSILAQTHLDIEIILVNDGSPDGCAAICEKYAAADSRIIVINQENKGLPGARNSGLKIAKGEFVGFIDSDDVIDADMVEDFVNVALNNYKPDVIASNIIQYENGNVKYQILKNELPYGVLLKQEEIKKHFIEPYYGGYMGIIPSACTKIYKTAFLKKNNLKFDESLKRAEDYWFNFYVFLKLNNLYAIDKAYYHYFKNEGSIIRSYRENQFALYLKSREKLLWENNKLNCKIDWQCFNAEFINNTNEYILLCIKKLSFFKSYKKVMQILKNNEFSNAIQNISLNKLHNRLIKMFLHYKLYMFVYLIYYSWSKKI